MINGHNVLALIPARGGSKGLPGKNIRKFCGKPLIAWTIEAALGSKYIDRVVLSSDDDEIIAIAKAYGCDVPFVREPELALDDTPSIDVVVDAINRCPGYEWTVLLQPTSPLRLAEDIDGALNLCCSRRAPACVSVTETNQSPYWMYTMTSGQTLSPILPTVQATRRQDLPNSYALNGAVYAAQTDWLLASKQFISSGTLAYLMPSERSLDIDTKVDFMMAEFLHVNADRE
ncbi:MAG: cytidylyltransferase domain-containing protein [Gallionellaceae bacterium]